LAESQITESADTSSDCRVEKCAGPGGGSDHDSSRRNIEIGRGERPSDYQIVGPHAVREVGADHEVRVRHVSAGRDFSLGIDIILVNISKDKRVEPFRGPEIRGMHGRRAETGDSNKKALPTIKDSGHY